MTKYLVATVYTDDGRAFLGGTKAQDIPEEFRNTFGDHVWTEEDPNPAPDTTDAATSSAALQRALAERDADVSELRKQLETVTAERDALKSQLAEQQEAGGAAQGGEDLQKLTKDELVALAQERGVDVNASATKAEIIAALGA